MELSRLITSMPHAVHLGIELVDATPEGATATMPWREEICTVGGIAHGGALMAFADAVGAIVAFLNVPRGSGTTTIESKTNFFRPLASGTAHATATTIHAGRTTIVVQTELRDDAGKLVTLTAQTQAVLAPPA